MTFVFAVTSFDDYNTRLETVQAQAPEQAAAMLAARHGIKAERDSSVEEFIEKFMDEDIGISEPMSIDMLEVMESY